MKKLLATLVVLSLFAALAITAATAAGSGTAITATTRTVKVDDNVFRSGTQKIRSKVARLHEDDIIRFEWVGVNTHNVRGTRGNKFRSETTDETGFRYRKRFTRDSTVICEIHPTTMKFKVDVVEDN